MVRISLLVMILAIVQTYSNRAGAVYVKQCEQVDLLNLKSQLLDVILKTKFGEELPEFNKSIKGAEKDCAMAIKAFTDNSSEPDKQFSEDQADIRGLLGNIFGEPTPALYVRSAGLGKEAPQSGLPSCDNATHIKQTLEQLATKKGGIGAVHTSDLNAALTPEEQKCAKGFVIEKQEHGQMSKDEQDVVHLIGEIDPSFKLYEVHRLFDVHH